MGLVYSKLAATPLWARANNWQKVGLVNVVSHLVAFWGPNLWLFAVAYFRWFSQYKIQKTAQPAADLVKRAFVGNVLEGSVLLPLLSYPLYKLLTGTSRASDVPDASDEDVDFQDDEEAPVGWCGLQFGEASRPAWTTSLWQIAVGFLGYDFMFYWSHRLLHSKYLYKSVHKQHHLFRTSIGLAASFQHPVEGAMQLLNWFLPIAFAGWLNKRLTNGKRGLHISTLMGYNMTRWVETVDAHCGYIFPFSPFARIPLFGGAEAHDLHHSGDGLEMIELDDGTIWADFGNYGATVIWDKLLGTESSGHL